MLALIGRLYRGVNWVALHGAGGATGYTLAGSVLPTSAAYRLHSNTKALRDVPAPTLICPALADVVCMLAC